MNNHKLLENSRVGRKPFFAVAATTLAAIAVSIYCLSSDCFIIFQNLFYVPIVIACMYYTKKGFVFSVVISFFYFFLIVAFTRDLGVILQAFTRVCIFISIAGITVFLSIKRKRAEEEKSKIKEYNWSQKNESLRCMSGSIAHIFNNQLSIVMGYIELVVRELPAGDSRAVKLAKAMDAAKKASEVSGNLLAYLGQKQGKLETFDLAEICCMSLPAIRTGKPENVILKTDLPSLGPSIRGDTKQVQQILTNLIVNAWEAIADRGGTIDLKVSTVSPADIPESNRFPVDWHEKGQHYACLEVANSGCGINESEIDKLFDPFFSTKFTGRGLGLSVVLGIVKTHGAVITVENRVSGGVAFRVFFPITAQTAQLRADKFAETPKIVNGGAVLLVEDEAALREMTKIALIDLGFAVLQAKDGVEAVELFGKHKNEISCLFCDLTMPRMGGWETISALRVIRHDLPVILASGYDEARVMAGEHPELPDFFLSKPYDINKLGDMIGRAMARKAVPSL